jgi:hypothetical protein
MGCGAIKEFFETVVVVSSKEENYNHIPKGYTVPLMQIIFTVLVTIHF